MCETRLLYISVATGGERDEGAMVPPTGPGLDHEIRANPVRCGNTYWRGWETSSIMIESHLCGYYVANSWKSNYKCDDMRGIKRAICVHERDSKCKIYVVLFGFWGDRGSLGDFRPHITSQLPPNLRLLSTPLLLYCSSCCSLQHSIAYEPQAVITSTCINPPQRLHSAIQPWIWRL